MMRLSGTTALVTGASGGIGQGARVVVHYRGNPGGERETVDRIEQTGSRAVAGLAREAFAAFGTIDVPVNNAGIEKKAFFRDVTKTDYDLVQAVSKGGLLRNYRE